MEKRPLDIWCVGLNSACPLLYVVLGQFYIKNAGIYPENNVVLESMIICEFETKQ